MEEKTEGILLHAIPYLGCKKILKVFTPVEGLIALIANKPSTLNDPFLRAEWVYKKGKGEIYALKDTTLLDDFSDLRHNYATLCVAGAMAQALLRSQFPSKKGGGLYALILAYLKRLSACGHPQTLLSSFRLKLLLHEGLLALQKECSHCAASACCISEGESHCISHAKIGSLVWTANEWEILHTLTYARQFAVLQFLPISIDLQNKIENLFEAIIT